MNDPWDVKSVLRAGQYVSCMKINGVPLLPPVLSRECREEMSYYKILAKEVEKRLAILKPLVAEDTEFSDNIDSPEKDNSSFKQVLENNEKENKKSQLNITQLVNYEDEKNQSLQTNKSQKYDEIPERDYNTSPRSNSTKSSPKVDLKLDALKDMLLEGLNANFVSERIEQDGPSSLTSKSFTGSLNDIHSESKKEVPNTKLVRQRSYTLLTPSPHLLAHLEVQSLSTGVDMTSISMSESLCNLSPFKKRRSWDLESAKMKWSHMAKELSKKDFGKDRSKTFISKQGDRKCVTPQQGLRSNSVTDRGRRSSLGYIYNNSNKILSKSNTAPAKLLGSPVRKTISNKIERAKTDIQKSKPDATSENVDPAARVRELYEKVQKQQLMQMATLIEKQKKEQLLLQQVFEQQNSLLYKQLKSICPKSPVQAKEAWQEINTKEADQGPVSLSQLINLKPVSSPVIARGEEVLSTTLTDTNNYLNQCNSVLKKSRDITKTIKNNTKVRPINRQLSPNRRNGNDSKVQQYDTSSPSDREYEDAILTDRTNDTMADLNFTFTDDSGTECNNNNTCIFKDQTKSSNENSKSSNISAQSFGISNRGNVKNPVGKKLFEPKATPQEITAACYNIHDTFVNSSPSERCAIIASDRARKKALASRQSTPVSRRHSFRPTDVMSQSHSGVFSARGKRTSIPAIMSQSNYESSSGPINKRRLSTTELNRPRPRPWR